MNTNELAKKMGRILSEKKAEDISIIDINERSGFADFMLIATANNERHLKALTEDLEYLLNREDIHVRRVEGKEDSGWILMDYGDIIVNIMTAEARSRYDVERIWEDCRKIILEEE